MPAVFRSLVARVTLVSIFLIPLGLSSLRGMNHVITCRDPMEAPFQVLLIEGSAVIISAQQLENGAAASICGGLSVELSAALEPDGRVAVSIPISNLTSADWFGSVQLVVSGTRIPIDLGRVDAGETRRRRVSLALPDGTTEFSGVLLVGP